LKSVAPQIQGLLSAADMMILTVSHSILFTCWGPVNSFVLNSQGRSQRMAGPYLSNA
jgi:hypothetical protein